MAETLENIHQRNRKSAKERYALYLDKEHHDRTAYELDGCSGKLDACGRCPANTVCVYWADALGKEFGIYPFDCNF